MKLDKSRIDALFEIADQRTKEMNEFSRIFAQEKNKNAKINMVKTYLRYADAEYAYIQAVEKLDLWDLYTIYKVEKRQQRSDEK